ncbi:HNH endonuclease [Chroococcidiopsis sp.]|uniref:HNH endonuclease n=1 Tax=Chroococcidiopsis sp. TaxID=3088168 RepID=UPI003F364394
MNDFDTSKFVLAVICKRNYDWNQTRQSLRYTSTRQCVECQKAWGKEYRPRYYAENQDRLQRKAREYHWENRDKRLEQMAEYSKTESAKASKIKHREQNKDSLNAKTRKWRERNAEHVSSYNQKHYQENLEYHKQRSQKYRQDNQDKISTYEKNRRQQNRDFFISINRVYRQTEHGKLVRLLNEQQRKARKCNAYIPYTANDIKARFNQFEYKCAYCGKQESLTIDHVIAISKDGKDCISNIIPACLSCNSSKYNREVYTWYAQQSFFDEKRWAKIQELLFDEV